MEVIPARRGRVTGHREAVALRRARKDINAVGVTKGKNGRGKRNIKGVR